MRGSGAFGNFFALIVGVYLAMLTIQAVHAIVTTIVPAIETSISPVVQFGFDESDRHGGRRHIEPVSNVWRDGEASGFDLGLKKLSAAQPLDPDFEIKPEYSNNWITAGAYPCDAQHVKLKGGKLPAHPVGATWIRHYCFVVPYTARPLDFLVRGVLRHRRHWFYDTATPTPTFEDPAPG